MQARQREGGGARKESKQTKSRVRVREDLHKEFLKSWGKEAPPGDMFLQRKYKESKAEIRLATVHHHTEAELGGPSDVIQYGVQR